MNEQKFAQIFDEVITRSETSMVSKGQEYAPGANKLHNFEMAANLQQTTMRDALGGMMAKHTISIFDMIGEDAPRPMEIWDEKIGDMINYLILLKAVVTEELEKNADNRVESRFNHPSNSRDSASKPEDNTPKEFSA